MNVANLITVLRFPLLVVIVLLLYFGGAVGQLMGAPLTLGVILMDSLDGIVARRRNEQTLIGGALDIAADRAVEVVLWVVYAQLRLITVAIPLTVVIRGALTDSIRNVALQHGQSAHSMMRSSWGRWLVNSSAMRTIYGLAKAVAFTLLALALGLQTGGHEAWHNVWLVASVVSLVAVVICVVRGLPVLMEIRGLFRPAEFQVAAPPLHQD